MSAYYQYDKLWLIRKYPKLFPVEIEPYPLPITLFGIEDVPPGWLPLVDDALSVLNAEDNADVRVIRISAMLHYFHILYRGNVRLEAQKTVTRIEELASRICHKCGDYVSDRSHVPLTKRTFCRKHL